MQPQAIHSGRSPDPARATGTRASNGTARSHTRRQFKCPRPIERLQVSCQSIPQNGALLTVIGEGHFTQVPKQQNLSSWVCEDSLMVEATVWSARIALADAGKGGDESAAQIAHDLTEQTVGERAWNVAPIVNAFHAKLSQAQQGKCEATFLHVDIDPGNFCTTIHYAGGVGAYLIAPDGRIKRRLATDSVFQHRRRLSAFLPWVYGALSHFHPDILREYSSVGMPHFRLRRRVWKAELGDKILLCTDGFSNSVADLWSRAGRLPMGDDLASYLQTLVQSGLGARQKLQQLGQELLRLEQKDRFKWQDYRNIPPSLKWARKNRGVLEAAGRLGITRTPINDDMTAFVLPYDRQFTPR